MSVEIIYETHSISTDNEAGIATGWLPGRLSDEGRRLAAELGRRRRDDDLAAVLVSDLTRAVETADIAFGDTGIPIQHDRRLRECNYGRLNGMPTARLHAERLQHLDTPWPGGQSYHQVVDQTRDLLRDLAADWNGQPRASHRAPGEPVGPRPPPARSRPGRPRALAVQLARGLALHAAHRLDR